MADIAYVETGRRWLQQPALPAGVTQRFVARPEGLTTGSPTPLSGSAFELTEDCRTSRNVLTSPALAFASVSSVFKEQSTRCVDTGVSGTLFAGRTVGA